MEINTILYNASEVMPYLCTVVPIVSLFILPKQDIKMKSKVAIMIFEIISLALLFFYTKNLIEMPKVVDDLYSDAIQTLNEHELTHTLINKNEKDIDDTKYWRVTYQSVPEGNIISKGTTVSLVIDKIAEENSKSEDNSITSNGDNTINIQNHEGGVIQINYNTDTTQSQTTERFKQNEDITSEVLKNETTTIKSTIVNTTIKNGIEIKETKPKETSVPINNDSTTTSFKTTTAPISTYKTTTILNTEWYETEISEILYIKIECYSRTRPIVGADAVKKYSVGTEIHVIAATDTSFYKLADGTYIHTDYVSDQISYETTIAPEDDIEEQPYEQTQNYDYDSFWHEIFGY